MAGRGRPHLCIENLSAPRRLALSVVSASHQSSGRETQRPQSLRTRWCFPSRRPADKAEDAGDRLRRRLQPLLRGPQGYALPLAGPRGPVHTPPPPGRDFTHPVLHRPRYSATERPRPAAAPADLPSRPADQCQAFDSPRRVPDPPRSHGEGASTPPHRPGPENRGERDRTSTLRATCCSTPSRGAARSRLSYRTTPTLRSRSDWSRTTSG